MQNHSRMQHRNSTANVQFEQVKSKHPSSGALEGYVRLSGAPYGAFPR